MVYRIYVEKKSGLDHEAKALLSDLRGLLGINALQNVRICNRYDVENVTKELFDSCSTTVFSEPQLDNISNELPTGSFAAVFADVKSP